MKGILVGYISEKDDGYLIEPFYVKQSRKKRGRIYVTPEVIEREVNNKEVKGNVLVSFKDKKTFFKVDEDAYEWLRGAIDSENWKHMFKYLIFIFKKENIKGRVKVNELGLDFQKDYESKKGRFLIKKKRKKSILDWA